MKLPLWVKVLQTTDRLAWYSYRIQEVVRDELLFAWLDPELRGAVTSNAYTHEASYLPGGGTFEQGFFGWEENILSSPIFPREGHVLLGAAGGGREMRELAARGYRVTGFEPSGLIRGAQEVAKSAANCRVLPGSYQDLTAAVEGKGPLREISSLGPFDMVIFGWGSLTHMLEPNDQRNALIAVRKLAPNAPVLISFFLRDDRPQGASRTDKVRKMLRKTFRAIGGREPPSESISYSLTTGFSHTFTERELHGLVHSAGYEAAVFEAFPFPHAVLVPRADAR